MLNFDYHNPTRIAFGQGRIADLATLVPAQAKVLILVGGASAEKTGTLAEVRAALGARTHATFSGIEPNPSYETAMQAVAQIRREGFDFLLAVGGGSVIDAVKFIAAAVPFADGDPWTILEKHGRNVAGALGVAGPIGQLTPYVPAGYGCAAIIVAFVGRLHPAGT